jgi:hypothetical protein
MFTLNYILINVMSSKKISKDFILGEHKGESQYTKINCEF